MTMQIDRGTGTQVLNCDTCPDALDTEIEDFREALASAKEKGWRVYLGPDKQWAHSCPGCTAQFATESRR